MLNIRFIGFGNLAQSMIRGLSKQNNLSISVSSPSLKAGVNTDGVMTYDDNKTAIHEADLIIIAVKPPKVFTVLAEIKPNISSKSLVISVAAGIRLEAMAKYTASGQGLVRAMPNLPVSVQKGATALYGNSDLTPLQKSNCELLFNILGIFIWAKKEKDLDLFTAFSGSGPAYIFFFLEAITKAAENLGLDSKVAKDFAIQTMDGALDLASSSKKSFETLRKEVTSPQGTTEAAINYLENNAFVDLIQQALQAAYDRALKIAPGHR